MNGVRKNPKHASFQGTLEVSPVTGRLEPHYPHWKRNVFRWCVSVPIIALCLSVVFVTVILILQLQVQYHNVPFNVHV